MYFAYFDESGDPGFENSPTNTFVLSAVLIHDSNWLAALDQSVAFRRFLKAKFNLSPRSEIKANWLVHNKGTIKATGLTYPARMAAYKAAMRFQRKTGIFKTFSIVIVKDRIKKTSTDVRLTAWHYALQRLERFGTEHKDNIMVMPDEGHSDLIKKELRKMRRIHYVPSAFGEDYLDRKATNIIEDPADRNSKESYFVQFADLNAYAAFRRVFPGNNFKEDIWDELGDSIVKEVNRLSGGPPGIVIWPTA